MSDDTPGIAVPVAEEPVPNPFGPRGPRGPMDRGWGGRYPHGPGAPYRAPASATPSPSSSHS